MIKTTESDIEALSVERLQVMGFNYTLAPDIASDLLTPKRGTFAEMLLLKLKSGEIRMQNG